MKSRKRLSWLKHNHFINRTTLSFLHFIDSAKSEIEIVFWCLAVFVFSVLCIRNISELVAEYLDDPTQTSVMVASVSNNISLPQIDIKFKLSPDEFEPLQLRTPQMKPFELWNLYYDNEPKCLLINETALLPPTLNKSPVLQWTDFAARAVHSGDILYDIFQEYAEAVFFDNPWATQQREQDYAPQLKKLITELKNMQAMSTYQASLEPLRLLHAIKYGFPANRSTPWPDARKLALPLFIATSGNWKEFLTDWQVGHQLKFSLIPQKQDQNLTIQVYLAHFVTEMVYFRWLLKLGQTWVYLPYSTNVAEVYCLVSLEDHIEELAFPTLINYYMQRMAVQLEIQSQIFHLGNLANNKLLLKPSARLASLTKTCYSKSLEVCLKDCEHEVHLSTCGCQPWWLEKQSGVPVCRKYCGVQLEQCTHLCQTNCAHPCQSFIFGQSSHLFKALPYLTRFIDTGHYSGDSWSLSNIDPYLPIVSLDIQIDPVNVMHPVFSEHYTLTFTLLVASLSAAIDFWLRLNVMEIINIGFYICVRVSRGLRDRTENRHRLLEAKREELKLTLEAVKNNVRKKKAKFGWLRANDFYDQTEFSGFSFINKSRSIRGKIFWYSVIFFCLILTARNVYKSIYAFSKQPTHTQVQMVMRVEEKNLHNFTFILESSVFDYSDFMPGMSRMFHYAAFQCHNDGISTNDSIAMFNDVPDPLFFIRQTSAVVYGCPTTTSTSTVYGCNKRDGVYSIFEMFMGNQIRARNFTVNWRSLHSRVARKVSQQLDEYWEQSHFFSNQTLLMDEEREATVFDSFFHQSDKFHWQGVYAALIILKATSLGIDPIGVARPDIDTSELDPNDPNFYKSMSDYWLATEAYNHVTLEQLLAAVNNYLRGEITVSAGEIFLKDWSQDNETLRQSLTIQVLLPPDVTYLRLNVHSLNLARHVMAMQSIVEHFARYTSQAQCNGVPCSRVLSCFGGGELGRLVAMKLISRMGLFDRLFNYFASDRMELIVEGNTVQLEPFSRYRIQLQSSLEYKSELDDCYEGTMDRCVQDCIVQNNIALCSCIPWYLAHVTYQSLLCREPCVQVNDRICHQQCSNNLSQNNPCRAAIQTVQVTTMNQLKHYKWTPAGSVVQHQLPTYALEISKKTYALMHPRFIKGYEMNLSGLSAQLGGLLQFCSELKMPPKVEKEDKKPDWFNERDNLLLIQLVQEQPALWFVKSEDYKLKLTRKREMWQEIANKLNADREIESETRTKLQKEALSDKQAKEQWKYMLKRFNTTRNTPPNSGSAAVAPVQHRFIYYNAMKFVLQARDEHDRDTNLDAPSSILSMPGEAENDGSGYDSDWSHVSVPSSSGSRPPSAPAAMLQPSRCLTPQVDTTPVIPNEPKRRHTAAEQSDEALTSVLQSITQPKPMETWALGVAAQICQLNPVNQIKAKYVFSNIMTAFSFADAGAELPASMPATVRAIIEEEGIGTSDKQ